MKQKLKTDIIYDLQRIAREAHRNGCTQDFLDAITIAVEECRKIKVTDNY